MFVEEESFLVREEIMAGEGSIERILEAWGERRRERRPVPAPRSRRVGLSGLSRDREGIRANIAT